MQEVSQGSVLAFKASQFAKYDQTELASTLKASGASVGSVDLVLPHVRRLMPVECERLQGFPDDWTAGQADTPRYKQMGNAVAVPVVEWILKQITSIESSNAQT